MHGGKYKTIYWGVEGKVRTPPVLYFLAHSFKLPFLKELFVLHIRY